MSSHLSSVQQAWEAKVCDTPRRFADKIAQQQTRQREIDELLQQMTGLEIKNAFNPRRFSEKIALQKQRQNDLEEVMVMEMQKPPFLPPMDTTNFIPQSPIQQTPDTNSFCEDSPVRPNESKRDCLFQPGSYDTILMNKSSHFNDIHNSGGNGSYHKKPQPLDSHAIPQHIERTNEYNSNFCSSMPCLSGSLPGHDYGYTSPRKSPFCNGPGIGSSPVNMNLYNDVPPGGRRYSLTPSPGNVSIADRIRDEIEGVQGLGSPKQTEGSNGPADGSGGGSQDMEGKSSMFSIDFLLRSDSPTNTQFPACIPHNDDNSEHASTNGSGMVTPRGNSFLRRRSGSLRLQPRPKLIDDPFSCRCGHSMRVRSNAHGVGGKVKVYPNGDYVSSSLSNPYSVSSPATSPRPYTGEAFNLENDHTDNSHTDSYYGSGHNYTSHGSYPVAFQSPLGANQNTY